MTNHDKAFHDPDKLLTIQDVAEILSLSPGTIRNIVRLGGLESIKICGSVRFRRSDVERLIDEGFENRQDSDSSIPRIGNA